MRMKSVARNACALAAMSLALGARAELRIAELCPKTAEVYDANGLESGWVELYNDGEESVDLADYELQRFNLGKKVSAGKYSRLPSHTVAPGERFVVYTSDEYPNSEDEGGDGAAFRGTFAAQGAAKGTVASRLGYRYVEVNGDVAADDRLVFAPQTVQKDRRVSTVEMTINFPDALPSLGDLPGALGALTLARGGNGEPVFCIHDGSAWREVSHPSVVPAEDSAYRIRIALDCRAAQPTVSYSVRSGAGWADLADANGATAFPIAGKASSFAFSGFGEVGDFGGDYEAFPGLGLRLR